MAVLVLSMHDREQYLLEAVRAGAAGHVVKSEAEGDLVAACRAVVRGDPFPHPGIDGPVLDVVLRRPRDAAAGRPGADREGRRVVKRIAEGHSDRESAELLMISAKTVERHRANILQKLGLCDRVDLVRFAIRARLAEP